MAKRATGQRKALSKKLSKKSAKKKSKSAGKPKVNHNLLTYYRGLAVNTPKSLKRGAAAIAKILAVDPNDPWANAEEAHRLVNEWRNGADVPDLGALFAQAHYYAQRAISVGATHANPRARPYGFWAEGFVYKYEGKQTESSANYLRAALYSGTKFQQLAGRRRRALMVEIMESYVYWASEQDLPRVIEWIEQEITESGSSERENWFYWVKCFALHLSKDFTGSDDIFKSQLSGGDKDISLIAAANYARLGNETKRRNQRNRFLSKPGNGSWSADIEDARSPFADGNLRALWKESVRLALGPDVIM